MTRTSPIPPEHSACHSIPANRGGPPLHRRVLTTLAAMSILGAAGCAGADDAPDAGDDAGVAVTGTPSAPAATDGPADAAGVLYEDGQYSETGEYQSPAGPEKVGVTLTLESDMVTAVEVEPMPENPTTTIYQERFAGGISQAIVGQKIDDLAVDKVAGSSLTSGGFNDAAEKIKNEARL